MWVRCRAAGQVPPNSSSKQKFDIFLPNKQPAHILFFALLTPVLLIFTRLLSNSVIQVVVSSPGKPRPLIFISFVIPHAGEFMYSPFTSVMSRSFSHCCLTGLAPSWGQPSIADSLLLSAVASSFSRLLTCYFNFRRSLAVCMHTSVLTEEWTFVSLEQGLIYLLKNVNVGVDFCAARQGVCLLRIYQCFCSLAFALYRWWIRTCWKISQREACGMRRWKTKSSPTMALSRYACEARRMAPGFMPVWGLISTQWSARYEWLS